MNLAAVASPHEAIAFPAYFSLVAPALRDLARGPLRRARHDGRPCVGVDGTRWCDECEETIDELLLGVYARLSEALAGKPPRTRAGEPVREMELIVQWLTSPEAITEELGLMARRLRGRPGAGEPAGLRAARAQLVHHPLKNFEARVRRESAMSRGASAKPERDLRTSKWAAPLRTDEVAFELLVDALTRLRNGACDPCEIPADRHGLDPLIAVSSLRSALDRLRALRPDFYRANVTVHLERGEFFPELFPALSRNPEDLLIHDEEAELARRTLSILLAGERTTDRCVHHRLLLTGICAVVPMCGTDLIAYATQNLGLGSTAAERFVRRLIRLASLAGLDWVAERVEASKSNDGAGEADVLGGLGDGGGGDGEVEAVVLAGCEDVQSRLVGRYPVGDDLPGADGGVRLADGGGGPQVAERQDARLPGGLPIGWPLADLPRIRHLVGPVRHVLVGGSQMGKGVKNELQVPGGRHIRNIWTSAVGEEACSSIVTLTGTAVTTSGTSAGSGPERGGDPPGRRRPFGQP